MKIYVILIFVVCVFALTSCNEEEGLAIKGLTFNGMEVQANFTKVTLGKKSHGQITYLLYADLFITSEEETYLNLNCLTVNFDDNHSKKIYVDSVASYLTQKYSVNKETNLSVYWSFHADFEDVDMDKLDLNLGIRDMCN